MTDRTDVRMEQPEPGPERREGAALRMLGLGRPRRRPIAAAEAGTRLLLLLLALAAFSAAAAMAPRRTAAAVAVGSARGGKFGGSRPIFCCYGLPTQSNGQL